MMLYRYEYIQSGMISTDLFGRVDNFRESPEVVCRLVYACDTYGVLTMTVNMPLDYVS
jgi:hypothetical protein